MKRFLNLFKGKEILKWPALVVSTIACLVFLITLTSVCVRPYSQGEYTYSITEEGNTFMLKLELEDDGEAELTQTYITSDDFEEYEENIKYKVIKGKLFCTDGEGSTDFFLVGKINSFEIVSTTWTAENKSAIAAKVCLIVFASLFAACALASGGYILISKKLAKKENQEVEVVKEAVEVYQEPQPETVNETVNE